MSAFCWSYSGATFASQHGGFVPREWQAAKGLFNLRHKSSHWPKLNTERVKNSYFNRLIFTYDQALYWYFVNKLITLRFFLLLLFIYNVGLYLLECNFKIGSFVTYDM